MASKKSPVRRVTPKTLLADNLLKLDGASEDQLQQEVEATITHPLKRTPECQPCFEEEGSYACIRPSHRNGLPSGPSDKVHPPKFDIDTHLADVPRNAMNIPIYTGYDKVRRANADDHNLFRGRKENWVLTHTLFPIVDCVPTPSEIPVILSDDWNLLVRVMDFLNPKKADAKRERPKMGDERVATHIKMLAGRVLTIIDATSVSESQSKALKTLIKKEFREQMNRVFKELWDDGKTCESGNPEEEAAKRLEL